MGILDISRSYLTINCYSIDPSLLKKNPHPLILFFIFDFAWMEDWCERFRF